MRCQAVYFYCCLSCIARACLTLTSARESMDTDTHKHSAKLSNYVLCIFFLYFLPKERKYHDNVVMLLQANIYKVHQSATVLHTSDI